MQSRAVFTRAALASAVLLAAVQPSLAKDYLVPTPSSPAVTIGGGKSADISMSYKVTGGTGSATNYSGLSVTFSVGNPSVPAGLTSSVSSGATCQLSAGQVCSPVIHIEAPAELSTEATYTTHVRFTPSNTAELRGTNNDVVITVTVPAAPTAVVRTKTVLTLDDKCGVLRGPAVTLTAHLATEAGLPVSGQEVVFKLGANEDGASIGTATTDSFGTATLENVDISSLPVGDIDIFAVFAGTDTYVGSADGAYLGLNYLFQGFMPPMNADGTSIFKTGRVIPFKIKILDGQGHGLITDATPYIDMFLLSTTSVGDTTETPVQGLPDTGFLMRYTNTIDDQYIYNWDLSILKNGTYSVKVDLHDSLKCGGWRPTLYGATLTVQQKSK